MSKSKVKNEKIKKACSSNSNINQSKKSFDEIKFSILKEINKDDKIAALIPVQMHTGDKPMLYMEQAVVNAVEVVLVKRILEGLNMPEEVYYLTEKQSNEFGFILRSIKKQMMNSKGGLALRTGK